MHGLANFKFRFKSNFVVFEIIHHFLRPVCDLLLLQFLVQLQWGSILTSNHLQLKDLGILRKIRCYLEYYKRKLTYFCSQVQEPHTFKNLLQKKLTLHSVKLVEHKEHASKALSLTGLQYETHS